MNWRRRLVCLCITLASPAVMSAADPIAIAPFSAEVTIPIGHRCMGILPTLAATVDDPLEANGFVLIGAEQPIVFLALDWCEVRNGAYDQWRDALASAAGTTRQRVLVSSLHQHDAPVTDLEAQQYLDGVGLPKALYDSEFHADCIRRVADAMRESMRQPKTVTHAGVGQATVKGVASSRRVVYSDGRISYDRYSSSGGDQFLMTTDDGPIDPVLRTFSFWNDDQPLLAMHSYATHPMSSYGKGAVSSDFVGLARRLRVADDVTVSQIYFSGCSGDVTAGKYNDGSPAMRGLLAERLHVAMKTAWDATVRHPIIAADVSVRVVDLHLPFNVAPEFSRDVLTRTLHDSQQADRERILAAMSLSSLDRVERRQPTDLVRVAMGPADVVLFPGESFVGYQLQAQTMCPERFVFSIGYGECWPGYVPTRQAFDEKFDHDWRWVNETAPDAMQAAMTQLLGNAREPQRP